MINRRIDISQSGKVWIGLAGLAVLLFIVWELTNSIAFGSSKTAILLAAAFVAFFAAGRIAGDWRSGVYLFFGWLLFEDLIRKYLGNSMYIYFVKDVLVFVVYISFFSDRSRSDAARLRTPFKYALVLFFILGLVQVFNPLSPSVFYGLLGLKLYFYYIPLMFVGYTMLRNEEDLRRFLVVSTVMAAIISIVGIIQSIVGLNFLNPYGGADIDELGHLVRFTRSGVRVIRPPSVFVSDGRYSEYLVLAFVLALATAGYLLLRSSRGGKFVFPSLGLVALATALAGARGPVVFMVASALVLSVGMLWGAPQKVGAGYRLVKAIRRSFFFVVFAVSFSVVVFPDAIGAPLAFYRETLTPDSENSELRERVWEYPLRNLEYALAGTNWVSGRGIGTASLGVQYVGRILEVPYPVGGDVENGFGALIVELGILGPLLWLAWTGSLVFAACKITLRLKGTWAFPLGLGFTWFSFLLLFPMTWASLVEYQNFVCSAYLWLFVGILFRLPVLVSQDSANPQGTLAHAS